jgi:hypothetical protein
MREVASEIPPSYQYIQDTSLPYLKRSPNWSLGECIHFIMLYKQELRKVNVNIISHLFFLVQRNEVIIQTP